MKKISINYWIFFVIIGTAGLNISCHKDHNIYQTKTTDLRVPEGFDWSMTKKVSYMVSSPVTTTISVYQDEACSEDQLVAKIGVSQKASPLTLEIPVSCEQIYIQYPNTEGKKSVLQVNVPQAKASEGVIILPDNAEFSTGADPVYGNALDHFICRGTVMFEDNWPYTGDYDFNDFVIYYDFCTKISRGSTGNSQAIYEQEGVTIKIQFRALGGNYSYQLGLQMDYLPARYIDSYDLTQDQDIVKVNFLNPGSEKPAIFVFEGAEKLKKQDESNFYNTETGYEVAKEQLITATVRLKMNCYNNIEKNGVLTASYFPAGHNFFLKAAKEIHLGGYKPTVNYTNYEQDAQDLMSAIPYYSKEGFVWGIKVPADTRHAIEKTDFIEAYPQFREWVTTNGNQNKDWYKHPDNSKVINMK